MREWKDEPKNTEDKSDPQNKLHLNLMILLEITWYNNYKI